MPFSQKDIKVTIPLKWKPLTEDSPPKRLFEALCWTNTEIARLENELKECRKKLNEPLKSLP